MRIMPLLTTAAALVLVSPSIAAVQAQMSLAGTWGSAPTDAPGRAQAIIEPGTVGKGVAQLRITQDANQLRIFSGRMSATYALDGRETTNYVRINGKRVPGRYRARWEDGRLVITGHIEADGTMWEETQELSLAPDGSLILEVRNVSRGARVHFKTTYLKRSDIMT